MEILVFSKNMERYSAAYYQQDFLRELAKQAKCYFYGPGYPGFREGRSMKEVLQLIGGRPNFIFTGHSFLNDKPSDPITAFSHPNLREAKLPIAGFINKEYTRLEEKLAYFTQSGHSIVFSHHHAIEDLSRGLPFQPVFSPFGVDLTRFQRGPSKRNFDLGFSGLLRNRGASGVQPEIREEIFRELFVTLGGLRMTRRWNHRRLRILWKSWSGNRIQDELNRWFLNNGKLSTDEYVAALKNSLIWLNSPSPLGIVSTRYFECMASGTLVLTHPSSGLERTFPPHVYRTFLGRSDFFTTLDELLSNKDHLAEQAAEAHHWVAHHGTWELRVKKVLEELERHAFG